MTSTFEQSRRSFIKTAAGMTLAGAAAAVTAAQEGAGSVLLLEKSPWTNGGGNSKYSSGWALFTYNVDGIAEYLKNCRGAFDATHDARGFL